MAVNLLQSLGFITAIVGFSMIIIATAMDDWQVEDRYSKLVTSVYTYQGLWYSCVGQMSGITQCRPFYTILQLPALVQACRALMIVGIVLATIGILVSIFALKCIKIGNMEDKAKANLTLTSGIMFAVAGVCAIAGVSVYANSIVNNFVIQSVSINMGSLQTRYTFGPALFVGWVGGGLLLVGGIMMCVACKAMMPEKTRQVYLEMLRNFAKLTS
ncbi:claudin-18 isoform X2 [Erpetoichthys calabaricus]|uniref:claudin-18 isoform X2 n=1 Tax=Erpetoichthys calabaricus TaxID=27687 RepID=UPI00223417DF|nr:claudin-18 isoform X2 [Erpetoichthys calabaricus]